MDPELNLPDHSYLKCDMFVYGTKLTEVFKQGQLKQPFKVMFWACSNKWFSHYQKLLS